jgi:hypothetical protein
MSNWPNQPGVKTGKQGGNSKISFLRVSFGRPFGSLFAHLSGFSAVKTV